MYKIPASVIKAAKYALELRQKYRRGGTVVGIATARRLAAGGAVPFSFVKKVSQYFPRHAGDLLNQINPPSNGHIAWNLWGGNAGRTWSEGIVSKVKL
jgi:hypothetical protein